MSSEMVSSAKGWHDNKLLYGFGDDSSRLCPDTPGSMTTDSAQLSSFLTKTLLVYSDHSCVHLHLFVAFDILKIVCLTSDSRELIAQFASP